MSLDLLLLIYLGTMFALAALALSIDVDTHDWPMLGVILVFLGAASLIARNHLREAAVLGWAHDDLLWLWRAYGSIGTTLVLTGILIRFIKRPPDYSDAATRWLWLLAFVVFSLGLVAAIDWKLV